MLVDASGKTEQPSQLRRSRGAHYAHGLSKKNLREIPHRRRCTPGAPLSFRVIRVGDGVYQEPPIVGQGSEDPLIFRTPATSVDGIFVVLVARNQASGQLRRFRRRRTSPKANHSIRATAQDEVLR